MDPPMTIRYKNNKASFYMLELEAQMKLYRNRAVLPLLYEHILTLKRWWLAGCRTVDLSVSSRRGKTYYVYKTVVKGKSEKIVVDKESVEKPPEDKDLANLRGNFFSPVGVGAPP